MRDFLALTSLALGALGALGCGSSPSTPSGDIVFGAFGSSSAPSGKGSSRFGASSAATQIEDQNTHTDWYEWTNPAELHRSPFVGEASDGYTMDLSDVQLLSDLHLDSYRFSMEWARIEPQKGV